MDLFRAAPDGPARAQGALLGLVAGSALGHVVRGLSPMEVLRIHGTARDVRPSPELGAPAALALQLAESAAVQGAFDPADVVARWRRWVEAGERPLGVTSREAFAALRLGLPAAEAAAMVARVRPGHAGAGAMARALPLVLLTPTDRVRLRRWSYRSAALTHGEPTAAAAAMTACLLGVDLLRHPLVDAARRTAQAVREDAPNDVLAALRPAALGDALPEGYDAAGTLAAAVTALRWTATLEEAVVLVVDRGGNSDTAGALVGGLAGLAFGAAAVPPAWRAALGPTVVARCQELALALWRLGQAAETPA
ncbi:MAG TPA: ADP-ribosylglycohydrolase family protein [Candidatus Dormibacteraeota bacterium]|nr:ADP-ribosylglycohydrolase family protein [Candidatus Dormibacteraeota bacterium]